MPQPWHARPARGSGRGIDVECDRRCMVVHFAVSLKAWQ
jgi:hypothetical protein